MLRGCILNVDLPMKFELSFPLREDFPPVGQLFYPSLLSYKLYIDDYLKLLFFRLPPVARNHIISIEAMKFLVNVTITDLDPKSIHHHKKYLKQIQDSIGAYREFMSRIKR